MSEEQILGQSSFEQMAEVSKRRRTPSQYATQIADFKSVNEPPSRTTPSLPKKTKTTNSQKNRKPLSSQPDRPPVGGSPAYCPLERSFHSLWSCSPPKRLRLIDPKRKNQKPTIPLPLQPQKPEKKNPNKWTKVFLTNFSWFVRSSRKKMMNPRRVSRPVKKTGRVVFKKGRRRTEGKGRERRNGAGLMNG